MAHDLLQNTAARVPAKVAVVCDGRRVTYAAVDAMANRLANALVELNLQRGDRVVVHLENSIEAVATTFGVLKAGAAAVPVHSDTKPVKLAHILNHCAASALVTSVRSDVAALWRGLPSLRVAIVAGEQASGGPQIALTFADLESRFASSQPPERCTGIDLALVLDASGRTGPAGALRRSHRQVVFAARSVSRHLRPDQADIVRVVHPLASRLALYRVFATLGCGGTVVFKKAFRRSDVRQLMGRKKVRPAAACERADG